MTIGGAQPPEAGPNLRGLVRILIIDVVCPYVAYQYLTRHAPGVSTIGALAIAGAFPAAGNIFALARHRRVDILGAIVLVGILVSIAAALLGGSPKVFLIRESFVTGALGIVCLASLLFRRPLLFYIGREFSTGNDPARVAAFDALWQYPQARRTFRVMSVVWGLGWIGEFMLRVLLALTLPVAQVLVVGPLVLQGITLALIAWTLQYARRARRRRQEQADKDFSSARA